MYFVCARVRICACGREWCLFVRVQKCVLPLLCHINSCHRSCILMHRCINSWKIFQNRRSASTSISKITGGISRFHNRLRISYRCSMELRPGFIDKYSKIGMFNLKKWVFFAAWERALSFINKNPLSILHMSAQAHLKFPHIVPNLILVGTIYYFYAMKK